jgi:hypothetical protein
VIDVKITMIGGQCPVQAEGTILGRPFYFRARGRHYSISIGGVDPMEDPQWRKRVRWGQGDWDAGYITEDVAQQLIIQAASQYASDLAAGIA